MNIEKFIEILKVSNKVVIIQADNPDGDSLASALALESILGNLGKEVILYCGVDIPAYLRYMSGWDRVVRDLPNSFDLSIIVDTSAVSLLESLVKDQKLNWIKTKPCVVIDHHTTDATIDFAQVMVAGEAVSTGEIIYQISKSQNWELTRSEAEYIVYSILSDSMGLTSESVTSKTMHILGELISLGVSLAELDNRRRSMSKKTPELVAYKGVLLQRVSYQPDSRIATIDIPWTEIETYSHAYNPSMLVIDEMRMTLGVDIAIAFKTYPDGKITAKIRSNYGVKIAGKVAEHFGGGGHVYASGFKVTDGKSLNQVKSECIALSARLLDEINRDKKDEVIQHTF